MNKKSPTIIKFIIEEILFSNSCCRLSYLIKIGIKADVNAPLIKISKTMSGRRNEAKKRSNSSLEKKAVKVRYLKNPKILEITIINAKIKAEEKISFCLKKIIFLVLFKNFSTIQLYQVNIFYSCFNHLIE